MDILEKINERITCPIATTPVTRGELKDFERYLDKIFSALDIDVDFTKHFLDRLNDDRNGKQITICELQAIFEDLKMKHGMRMSKQISPRDVDRIIKSVSTDINIPVVVQYNRKDSSISLVAKTIMRKRDFKSPEPKLLVEEWISILDR